MLATLAQLDLVDLFLPKHADPVLNPLAVIVGNDVVVFVLSSIEIIVTIIVIATTTNTVVVVVVVNKNVATKDTKLSWSLIRPSNSMAPVPNSASRVTQVPMIATRKKRQVPRARSLTVSLFPSVYLFSLVVALNTAVRFVSSIYHCLLLSIAPFHRDRTPAREFLPRPSDPTTRFARGHEQARAYDLPLLASTPTVIFYTSTVTSTPTSTIVSRNESRTHGRVHADTHTYTREHIRTILNVHVARRRAVI